MRSFTRCLILLALPACNTSSGGGSPLAFNGGNAQQVVCDAPLCGSAQFGLTSADEPPALHLELLPPAAAAAHIRQAFADGDEGAHLLIRAATEPGLPAATRAWLAHGLDTVVPTWRTLKPTAAPDDTPAIATGRYALDTSGCGDMALRIELTGVTVIERDDNSVGDRVYCLVQATDDHEVEVLHTGVTAALQPNETAQFSDSVLYGRAAPKDPGSQLDLRYDCWEHDSTEDYDNFRDAVDAIERLGKAFGSTTAITLAKAARIVIELAAVLDGDDHLYTAQERLGRQALWTWINNRDRTVSKGGTHFGSDWSWELHFQADGCAGGVSAPPVDSAQTCDASNCNGCCVGTRCVDGRDEQTCGQGGDTCRSCDPGETCGGGSCAFNPNTQFSLKIERGRVAATKANGDCWDDLFGGCDDPPDPYLDASSGGRSGRAPLQRDTYNPSWNATVLQGIPARDLMNGITFEATDDDVQFDDLIGRCTFALDQADLLDGGAFEIQCGQIAVTFSVGPQ